MQERVLDSTYRLLEEIGRGGFGTVWRAVRLGAEGSGPVAVKILSRGNVLSLQDQIRFQREATMMSQLLHPGTVTVFELGESEGRAYIVMEYVDGPNLREYVKSRGGRLPLSDILEVLIQATEALEYVHGHNIVHRDIKPQNILVSSIKDSLDSKFQIKIVDFGVARLNDPVRQKAENNRARSEVVGTLNYMAPESTGMVDWPLDARADIYSLGIVAYELIVGRPPFHEYRNDELLRAHLEKKPPSFAKQEGLRVPEVLERIVMKCIAKRPEERYQSMFGLLTDLKKLLEMLRTQENIDFEIATKDVALSRLFNHVFVGRDDLMKQVMDIVGHQGRRTRVTWNMIRSSVGLGRTRFLSEIRRQLSEQDIHFLHIRFTESEQRLPLRALSLAINEQLQALEIRSPHAFQTLMEELALIAGSGATDVARLIPALRPHLLKSVSTHSEQKLAEVRMDEKEETQDDAFELESLAEMRNFRGGNSGQGNLQVPIQQVFSELLGKLAAQNGYLVFLLDDLHLADNQSIGLFQFITEWMNDKSNFAFVMSIREGISRTNFVLENFLARLANLRRRFHVWDLAPLTQYDFQQFMISVGLPRPTPKFVEFVTAKCEGSPLMLHQLLKQMVETEALVPDQRDFNPWAPVFRVDWTQLSQIVVDTRNIEALLASLDRLDKRDQRLTSIAAVSHEACEFEYFRVDQDFSSVELETRLLSLVRRGVFEMTGDDNLPIQRRSFIFSHEKLRTAVLNGLDSQLRRQLHLAIANRIILLYPKPRREKILSLAKHFEGAGSLVDAERSSTIFLKAAQLYAKNFEHPLAKYYTERAMQRASTIGNQEERLLRLREVFETEYTIHVAQNELVAASNVCQQLVALTFDPVRKEVLQLHWSHLLLGLGRHSSAYTQIRDVVERKFSFPFTKVNDLLTKATSSLARMGLFGLASKILQLKPLRETKPHENIIQGLMYMALSQAHGADGQPLRFLVAALRLNLHRSGPTRTFAVFNMLLAAQFLRSGQTERAFEIAETLERAMESKGRVDVARWVRALRAIWLDYPMGRIERLARVLDERKDGQLPSMGVLNTESHALRSWIRTTSPRIWKSREDENVVVEKRKHWKDKEKKHPGGYVSTRSKKTRKVEQLTIHRNVKNAPESQPPTHEQEAFVGSHGKQSVRLREASENGQYTGLGLFSDALRYALSDRIDPLRRIIDQFARQKAGVIEGEVFKSLSQSLQDISAGQYKDALEMYISALRLLFKRQPSEVSLPVSDALRFGIILLPLFAFSSQSRGWPWGDNLVRVLRQVDVFLHASEGNLNPRRSPVHLLFQGVIACLSGKEAEALRLLGESKNNAKSVQNDLIACVAEQFMGLACSEFDQVRALDYFANCFRTSHDLGWKLFERQLLALCRRLKLPLQHQFPELLAESEKINFRRRTAGQSLSLVVESWLVMMREPQTVNHYINQAARVAAKILSSPLCLIFARTAGEKGHLAPVVQWVDDGNLFLQNLSQAPLGVKTLEAEMVRGVPRFHDDPVRLVPVGVQAEEPRGLSILKQKRQDDSRHEPGSDERSGIASTPDDASTLLNMGETQNLDGDAQRTQPDTPYAAYFAIQFQGLFFGWLAVGRVSLAQFANHETELELLLLANQTAFNFACEQRLRNCEESGAPFRMPAFHSLNQNLPEPLFVETLGRGGDALTAGAEIFSLSAQRVFIVSWQLNSVSPESSSEMGGLFKHYTALLSESLRISGDTLPLERFSLRFSTDVGGILERLSLTQRFERVRITGMLIDLNLNEAQECVFGQEQMSFSGSARVERELLLELNGVLRLERLVYRERRRVMTSSSYAWLLSFDQRFRDIVPQFSRAGFLEEYLNLRKNRGIDLSHHLAGGALPEDFSAVALVVDGVSSSENVA